MSKYAIIGPTYPYRGGIANYTTLLAQYLQQTHDVLLVSFSRQYPQWLFPGQSDKDPSERPLQTPAEYLIDTVNPLTWHQAVKRVTGWQPDVLIIPWWHPYFTPSWAYISHRIKRTNPAVKLIYICHNVMPHEQSQVSKYLLPLALRQAIGCGDRYIVHSQTDEKILNKFFPEARIAVTPIPTYAAIGEEVGWGMPISVPNDRPLLLFCGFVRPYKGLDVLLDALAIALQERPFHLLVAGEFWQGGEALYRDQIARLQLEEHVSILNDYLPNEKLAACIDQSDVVVLPYRSATQSAVVQIAFGRGKPVITTDVGGLAEVVENGRTGLVVPPENPEALAQAILAYFEQDLKRPFSEAIAEETNRFSWARLVETIDHLVEAA